MYKLGIFLSILLSNNHLPSFDELVNLQKLNQKDFDATVINLGFNFSKLKYDRDWQANRYVYDYSGLPEKTEARLERVVDSLFFGKRNTLRLIVTLDFIIYDKQYYDDLLSACKKNDYYSFGSDDFDIEYPGMKTAEFRKATYVAKFSIDERDGKEFYKVSVSISPK